MKVVNQLIATACLAATLVAGKVQAGDTKVVKEVIVEEPAKWWAVNLATGWDSRYIFRGVDIIPGSSLYWLSGYGTANLTENDSITIGLWQAWGLTNTIYKEMDVSAAYTHKFGDLAFTAGYIFYYIEAPVSLYSHELNAGLSYPFDLGFMTLTPSAMYYFNLGPDQNSQGFTPYGSSYLALRMDGSIPVPIWMNGDTPRITLNPWVGLNFSFKYNYSNEYNEFFNGVNNFEFGVKMPVQLTDILSVSGYVASTYQWAELVGTPQSLVWAGCAVNLAF